jgi:acetyl esterase
MKSLLLAALLVSSSLPAFCQAPATPASLPGAETKIYRDLEPEPLRLHVYHPPGWQASDQRPVLIWFFGGGFLRGTPLQSGGWARRAAQWGMVGIAPDYRTRERFGTDATACVADARAAMRWVQENAAALGIDPTKIVVGGSSAGGHLALWTAIGETPEGLNPADAPLGQPVALILSSAPSDLQGSLGRGGERFGRNFEAYSPLQKMPQSMPPALLFHGDADRTVPYSQSVALAKALQENGNQAELITVPGGSHNFTSEFPEWRLQVAERVHDFLASLQLIPAKL